ncbi:unnamed protein product [Effrenium voratum]|uniref:Uncharacterized protein n=1 Tax=Effrenium voratum TaxID=2562239 RepID=A0AA36NMI3_9DINO|nr:unnamed protein product [Effrenium voratum]
MATTDVERHVMGNISEEAWRLLLGRALQAGSLPGGVDAVWKHPFCLLLDEDTSAESAMRKLEVVIEIQRPERGKARGSRHKTVGSAVYGLAQLFDRPEITEELTVPIFNAKQPAGYVRLRVQARPLLAPRLGVQQTGRPSIGERLKSLVRQCSGTVRPTTSMASERTFAPDTVVEEPGEAEAPQESPRLGAKDDSIASL